MNETCRCKYEKDLSNFLLRCKKIILLFALWFSGESCILQNPVTFLTSTQITRGDHLRRFHNIIYYLACIEICSPILIRGQQALLKSLRIL